MILPLTHEHGTVQRLPLVTFVIMAVCLLAHVRVASETEVMHRAAGRFGTALIYYLERPYLEADPRLAPPELADLLAEWGAASLAEGQPSRLQQKTLDGYTALWLESLETHPLWTGGLLPAELEAPDLVTHAFLHGGWLHLIGNMLFLYLMGPFVEDRWGRWTYAGFYLLGAVAAGLGFALHYPNLFRPLVGASGAVAAVMGAFLVLHGRAKVRFLYYLGFAGGTFTAPAWLMLPLWFVAQLSSALMVDSALPGGIGGGVAYWAHIWGFAFGLVVAIALRASGVERRLQPLELDDGPRRPAEVADPALAEAARLQGRREPEEARKVLVQASRGPGATVAVLQACWELCLELGRPDEGAAAGRRLIQEELRRGDLEIAWDHWREYARALPEDPEAARAGIPLAEALAAAGRYRSAEAVMRAVAGDLGPGSPLGLVIKAVRLADELGDGELFLRTLDAALGHPHLPEEHREELELRRPLT